MRLRENELQEAMHTIDVQKKVSQARPHSKHVDVFTIKGQEDYCDDSENPLVSDVVYEEGESNEYIEPAENLEQAYAKIIYGNKPREDRYYIKLDMYGHMYNPVSIYDSKLNKVRNRKHQEQLIFRQVNKKAFDLYMKFLRTKQERYITQAQREM